MDWQWKDKRVLLISPEPWGAAKLSKHHYALTLLERGATVFFVGPPGASWFHVEEHTLKGLHMVQTPRELPGMRFLPRWSRQMIDAHYVKALAAACGEKFDVIWNFDHYRLRSLKDRSHVTLVILHVVDLPVPVAMAEPARAADLVILIGRSMEAYLPAGVRHHMVIPHGLALPSSDGVPSPTLRKGRKLAIVGNYAMRYLHLPSLLDIARSVPDATLYLIGPLGGPLGGSSPVDPETWKALLAMPNVEWVGLVPSEQLGKWLEQMDLLLIAYDSARYLAQTAHPHKVLEYLASGKAILSSHLVDYAYLNDLLIMMPPGIPISEGFLDIYERLDELNSPERIQARKAFAHRMTYDHHMDTISEYLKEVVEPS